MKSSHAIVIWLFERLAVDVALTGDFLEESAQGHSALWYWRQVPIAICAGIWGTIRDHKALALRAVATGMAAEFLLSKLWMLFPDLPLFSSEWWIIGSSFFLLLQVAAGWIVARTHRTHPVPMVSTFLISIWFLMVLRSNFRNLLVDSITHPEVRRYLALYLDCFVLTIVGIVGGGVWGARPMKGRSSPASPGMA
jgi:hypothetical protein